MQPLARLRWTVARHPSIHWIAVALSAFVVWSVLHDIAADAAAERARWGESTLVWITSARVERGRPVTATAEMVPAALAPDDALDGDEPFDAVAAHDLAAGEVLVDHDLAGAGDVPAAWVVMAVPADTAPRLVNGDRVAVFGSGSLLCDGVVVAADAAGEIDGQSVVDVALPPDCAADASAHLTTGDASLGRRG